VEKIGGIPEAERKKGILERVSEARHRIAPRREENAPGAHAKPAEADVAA
jgi:hypothetical protein